MKTPELRNTVLILAGILLGTFLLSAWWVSRQASLLKEITLSLEQTREVHGKAKNDLTVELLKIENIRADIKHLSKVRETYPLPLMHRAKRGFNDLQRVVAEGQFKGLALTDGYIELKQIFDNPSFEDMLAKDHSGAERPLG
jgi:hypothetical protein